MIEEILKLQDKVIYYLRENNELQNKVLNLLKENNELQKENIILKEQKKEAIEYIKSTNCYGIRNGKTFYSKYMNELLEILGG